MRHNEKPPALRRRGSGGSNFADSVSSRSRAARSIVVPRATTGRRSPSQVCRSGLARCRRASTYFRRPRPPTVLRNSAIVLGSGAGASVMGTRWS